MRALILGVFLLALPAWADRPWYSGRTNIIKGSEVFTPVFEDYRWRRYVEVEQIIQDNAGIADDGRLVAAKITIAIQYLAGINYRIPVGGIQPGVYTFSVSVWSADGTLHNFRIARTNAVTWATATVSSTFTAGLEKLRFNLTFTIPSGESRADIHIFSEGKTPFLADAGQYFLHGAQLVAGSSPLPYHPTAAGATTTWSPRFKKGGLKWSPY